MKLSITSTEKLEKFYLKDLNNKVFNIELDREQNIPENWYELIVPYTGKKIEISDIQINDDSMKEVMYTGFYTDGLGVKHQPATAVWDDGGFFSIWIHTQSGRMWQRFKDQIRNKDWGTFLFDKYVFTVDRPIKVADYWNNNLKHYFGFGDGPNWWLKNNRFTPYIEIDSIDTKKIDLDKLISELDLCFPPECRSCYDGHTRRGMKLGPAELPFTEIKDLTSKMVQDFVTALGYKRIIDIQLQTLDPKTAIPIHKDHHFDRECYPWTSGAVKFYWNLTDSKDVYFKLGNAGLLPLEKPLFINATEHVHAVLNERKDHRTVLTMYGEL